MTPRARTFSQAPQAVRSARGRRGDGMSPSAAGAGRALDANECHAIRLTADVHRPGNVSGTAAARAGVRIHFSPSVVEKFFTNSAWRNYKANSVTKAEQLPEIKNRRMRGKSSSANFSPKSEGARRAFCLILRDLAGDAFKIAYPATGNSEVQMCN